MTDLPADRYIEEALRLSGYDEPEHLVDEVKASVTSWDWLIAHARTVEKLSKYEPAPEPVDPDLLIAREAAADSFPRGKVQILNGEWDDFGDVSTALRAIKLAREKGEL